MALIPKEEGGFTGGPGQIGLPAPAVPQTPKPPLPKTGGATMGSPCDPNNPGPAPAGNSCGDGRFVKCRDDSKTWGCKHEFVRQAAAEVTARGGSPLVGGAGFGPGGGGGASGGSPSGFNFNTYNLERDKFDDLYGRLQGIISGDQSRFSPEVMAGLDADAKLQQGISDTQARQSINEDAASRGLANSGVPLAALAQAKQGSSQAAGSAMRNTRVQKAMYDFQDKFDAIKEAGSQLDRMRQYALGLQQDSTQREQINAQLMLGREQMKNAIQQLGMKLSSDKELQTALLSSQEAQQIFQMFGGGGY